MSKNYFFCQGSLFDFIRSQEKKLLNEIDECNPEYILNVSMNDYCDYLESKYNLIVPVLKEEEIYICDNGEIDIDVSRDPLRDVRYRGRPFYVKGSYVTFAVPFDGDSNLFKYQPSSYTTILPRGKILNNEVQITYKWLSDEKRDIKSEFGNELQLIQRYLNWVSEDVKIFNNSINQKARDRIEYRREKLLKDQGIVASLGFPIKRRNDHSLTYLTSQIRRNTKILRPEVELKPFKPEPELDIKEYEYILNTIQKMVLVMERSPKAFSNMKEEHLRDHILVHLNGIYDGQATGETFNYEGKTDILIRENGRNLFIAECKFWGGEKILTETINQILAYTSWRDTKTAIIIFNRNKSLSGVLEKIPHIVKNHPNFKRELEYPSETGFRFIFHHRDDKNRELLLTILVFDIPKLD